MVMTWRELQCKMEPPNRGSCLPTQYAAECQQEEEEAAVGWVARWARMARREGYHDADEGGKGVFEARK